MRRITNRIDRVKILSQESVPESAAIDAVRKLTASYAVVFLRSGLNMLLCASLIPYTPYNN